MLLPATRRRPARRGASAFEFCVILPLLAVIVLACVDFGRFAYSYIALTNAARAGAEYGVMNPYVSAGFGAWNNQILEVARNEMDQQTSYLRTDLQAVVAVSVESNGLRRVKVTAQYPYRPLVSWPGLPGNLTMRRAVEMRAIR